MQIWPNTPPHSNGVFEDAVVLDENGHINNVHTAELIPFALKDEPRKCPAVIVIPGGGYGVLSSTKEGIAVAKWLNSFGFSAFVLHYRLPNIPNLTCRSMTPLSDGQRAMRLVRSQADVWNIDVDQIGLIGFSAGGHLAASLIAHHDHQAYLPQDSIDSLSAKPDFSLLIYPVISFTIESMRNLGSVKNLLGESPSDEELHFFSPENHLTPNINPVFITHAQDDNNVPVANSITLYSALTKFKTPTEMHLYDEGGHGFGLDQAQGRILEWPDRAKAWLLSLRS